MTDVDDGAIARRNRGPAAGPENRRALLEAAREVFAETGPSAPLSAIAKRAGVGQGSLYRHFPDRVALVAAVFEENLGVVEAEVAVADRSLDRLLEIIAEQAAVSARLIEVLWTHAHDARVQHLTERLVSICTETIEAERRAGRVGDDVDVDDILLAITMLAGALSQAPAGGGEATGRRARGILQRGLLRR